MNGWERVRLGDVCSVNPRRPALTLAPDAPTSFIPMAAVNPAGKGIATIGTKPYQDVTKGYTFFAEGDVLFAKITPCMQNGKHAVARGLHGGVGFGTTEFHVLRPGPGLTAEWLHYYLTQPRILMRASAYMTGSVGQQRLPADYLADLEIPLPPLNEQRRVTARLATQLAAVDRAKAALDAELTGMKALGATYLRSVMNNDLNSWPRRKLGDLLALRSEIIHPKDSPAGTAQFVGLEHIESGTGKRLGAIEIDLSRLTGRKPQFAEGDIVYGYLRPYLNKVWLAEFDGLCSVDQYVYRVDRDLADATYVAWFMRSLVFLRSAPINTSPGQLPRIRTSEVASVEMGLPPISDQVATGKRIDAFYSAQSKLLGTAEVQLQDLAQLSESLLHHAFWPELEVGPDNAELEKHAITA